MTVSSDRALTGDADPRATGALAESQRQAALFRALHELAVAAAGTTDVSTLARTVVEHGRALVGADTCALYLHDRDRDLLVPAAVADPSGRLASPATDASFSPLIEAGEGVTGRAFDRRTPFVVGDYQTWEHAVESVRATGLRTLAAIPLVVAERALGCLTVGCLLPDACDDETVIHLRLLTTQVAPLFETLHLFAAHEQAQRALRDLNATLESRVAERTAQLEAAVHELEAFSYTVSHDLRAPLRSISGYSQILLRDHARGLAPDALDCLHRVSRGAQRMGRLIDDLLRFARLGRHALTPRRVAMARLAREVIDSLAEPAAGHRVEFEISEMPSCDGDPTLLRQVLVNLIDNAVKYSRSRTIARIEIKSRVDGDETVYFVRDNGVGFDMRYADRLFGVFQRLVGTHEYEGTGVGLAIVQRIVHRHGGRVWAEAAVDQGATFSFTIGQAEAGPGGSRP